MEHLFLINPCAGKSDQSKLISERARTLCRYLGQSCEIFVSQHPGHLTARAKAAGASGRDIRLYACGGDGTLNEVVSGALGYENLSVTSIPCGSGNDFIKHLPGHDVFFDLNRFSEAETRRIDLIRVNDRISVNICSAGFDARIGTSIDLYRRKPLLSGSRAYQASILVNLFKGVAKPCRVKLEDGTIVSEKLTLVCVCNGSWYGGGYHPVPKASIFDGLLDVLVVKRVSRLTVARVISAYQRGRYADYPQFISLHRVRSLQITTPQPEPINLDGELLKARNTDIRVLPKAIRFFAPAGAWG